MRQVIKKAIPVLDSQSKLTLTILACFTMSALIYLSIINWAGDLGRAIGSMIIILLGRASFVLPMSFLLTGLILIKFQKNLTLGRDINARLGWGFSLWLIALTGVLSLFFRVEKIGEAWRGGGIIGYFSYPLLLGVLGPIGAFLIFIFLGLFGFFLISQLTFVQFIDRIQETVSNPRQFWDMVPDVFEVWKKTGQPVVLEQSEVIERLQAKKKFGDRQELNNFSDSENEDEGVERIGDNSLNNAVARDKIAINRQAFNSKAAINDFEKSQGLPKNSTFFPETVTIDTETGSQSKPETPVVEEVVKSAIPSVKNLNWQLPTFDILRENKTKVEPGNIEENKQSILETLKNFNIEVEMGEVVVGPTVSQYTLRPASGVKLSTIDSLQRDLALSLAASSIRIEAPIPGKSLVGIEIPNKIKSQVRLRDLIQTKKFAEFEGDLPVAIGLDVAGNNLIYSIAKMPHLLVAGATGAGKSVWINSMLLSLLYRYAPQDLMLILVDMKRVELKLYDNIPHLLAPVITDAEKAINALKWSVLEMDRRYKLLEEFGKRNIVDYNYFAVQMGMIELPYLVFIIDELGDLMIVAKNEVEPIVVRLTQMSRAVGIHLVLGTQRPDVKTVTGLIKANIPSRIAFAVASQIDSRVILDQGGAEKLLGQGDGFFLSPSTIQPIRFQGCLVEETEVRLCVKFWKEQSEAFGSPTNLNPDVLEQPKTKISVPGMIMRDEEQGTNDDIYERAKQYVISQQQASTSMLQTAFGIGYPKARKVIEWLEEEGIVGPPNGSKAREVYVEG